MDERQLQRRREECRREARRYLAERQALAFPVDAMRRKLNIDGNDFTDEEIAEACQFLLEMVPPQVKVRPDGLGATRYYQATSAGVLEHERSL